VQFGAKADRTTIGQDLPQRVKGNLRQLERRSAQLLPEPGFTNKIKKVAGHGRR
jgi:hypothetical protein